jgi:hypothetical protein
MTKFFKLRDPNHFLMSRVQLQLVRGSNGETYGTVHEPRTSRSGGSITANLTASEAIASANNFAREHSTDIEVSDPQGLWQSEWGTLE